MTSQDGNGDSSDAAKSVISSRGSQHRSLGTAHSRDSGEDLMSHFPLEPEEFSNIFIPHPLEDEPGPPRLLDSTSSEGHVSNETLWNPEDPSAFERDSRYYGPYVPPTNFNTSATIHWLRDIPFDIGTNATAHTTIHTPMGYPGTYAYPPGIQPLLPPPDYPVYGTNRPSWRTPSSSSRSRTPSPSPSVISDSRSAETVEVEDTSILVWRWRDGLRDPVYTDPSAEQSTDDASPRSPASIPLPASSPSLVDSSASYEWTSSSLEEAATPHLSRSSSPWSDAISSSEAISNEPSLNEAIVIAEARDSSPASTSDSDSSSTSSSSSSRYSYPKPVQPPPREYYDFVPSYPRLPDVRPEARFGPAPVWSAPAPLPQKWYSQRPNAPASAPLGAQPPLPPGVIRVSSPPGDAPPLHLPTYNNQFEAAEPFVYAAGANSHSRPFMGSRPRRRPAPFAPTSNPFHYEQKYTPDPVYEEMGPHARLWRVYLDESQMHDVEMIDDSKDSVDVLLVFAGLFSAVVTTFVAQTSQDLQVASDVIATSLIYELVNLQRAMLAGASSDSVSQSPLTPDSTTPETSSIVWVNGLWFVSLALSLTTALLSVLVKQWFHQYANMPSGTPRDRSLIRQFRFTALQDWQVPLIVGLLPVLMHAAVAIFFAGLVVYLYPLNHVIAGVTGGIAGSTYMAYIVSQLLPIVYPGCPYKTPLSNLVAGTVYRLMHWSKSEAPLKEREQRVVSETAEYVSLDVLQWLYATTTNPTVRSVVLQSFGGLTQSQTDILHDKFNDIKLVMDDQESMLTTLVETEGGMEQLKGEPGIDSAEKYERIVRSMLVCQSSAASFVWPVDSLEDDFTSKALHAVAGRVSNHDANIVSAPSFFKEKACKLHLTLWTSLASTILKKQNVSPYFEPIPPMYEELDAAWVEQLVRALDASAREHQERGLVTCDVYDAVRSSSSVQEVARLILAVLFSRFDILSLEGTDNKAIVEETRLDISIHLSIMNYFFSVHVEPLVDTSIGIAASLHSHLVTDPRAPANMALLHTCIELVVRHLEAKSFDLNRVQAPLVLFQTLCHAFHVDPDWPGSEHAADIRTMVVDACFDIFTAECNRSLFAATNSDFISNLTICLRLFGLRQARNLKAGKQRWARALRWRCHAAVGEGYLVGGSPIPPEVNYISFHPHSISPMYVLP